MSKVPIEILNFTNQIPICNKHYIKIYSGKYNGLSLIKIKRILDKKKIKCIFLSWNALCRETCL